MRGKMISWMEKKMIQMQGMLCSKSQGMGTVEVILIIVCLVGIVIIFKSQITELVESIFSKITSQSSRI